MKDWPIIRYICDTQDSGYGNAMRGYLQAFKTLGIDGSTLRIVPVLAPTSSIPFSAGQNIGEGAPFNADALMKTPAGTSMSGVFAPDDPVNEFQSTRWPGDDTINIVHLNPGMLKMYYTPIGGRYNIAITAWETNRLTRRSYDYNGEVRTMKQDLNDYDEIWVPTTHVKQVLESSGVEKPVIVIPHVIREEILAIKPKTNPKKGTTLGFYAIGPWNARKNHADLVRAYFATDLTITDKVRLQIFSLPVVRDENALETHEYIAEDKIRELKRACPRDKLDLPAVNLLGAPRHFLEHIRQAHINNHVFITASRAEGFSLPSLDAVALGNYVSGGFPALKDLAAIAPSAVTMMESREVPITPMPEVAGYEIDHKWNEVDLDDMIAEFGAMVEFIGEHGMPLADDIEAVRYRYCPSTVGKLITQRLEVASEVLASSGW
jgi:hypothetical protein